MKRFVLFFIAIISVYAILLSCDTATEEKTTETGDYNYVYEQEFQQGCLPSSAYIGAEDAYINESDPVANFSGSTGLFVGYYSKGFSYFSLMKFNLTSIPKQAKIQKAILILNRATNVEIPLTINFMEIITTKNYYWDEGSVTYNEWTASGEYDRNAGALTIPAGDATNVYNIPLNTAVVQNWIEKPEENLGLILRGNISSGLQSNQVIFISSDGALPNRPILAVYYTL